jgi:hypothetical protein
MPKPTPYVNALNSAHGQLMRGFDKALDKFGRVQLGHNILDPRTMESRQMVNMSLMLNPEGMTSGLPQSASKMYQAPKKQLRMPTGEGQTDKNKLAGIPVDPTAHETFTGADTVSADTRGGYGITPGPFPNNG